MNPIYWVLIASLVVWAGIFLYLLTMEGRLRRLEHEEEDRVENRP